MPLLKRPKIASAVVVDREVDRAWLLTFRARDPSGRFALDLERDLVKADRTQNIEHADDVEVDRVRIAANKHFRFRIFVMHFFELRYELIVSHLFLVEIRIAVGID